MLCGTSKRALPLSSPSWRPLAFLRSSPAFTLLAMERSLWRWETALGRFSWRARHLLAPLASAALPSAQELLRRSRDAGVGCECPQLRARANSPRLLVVAPPRACPLTSPDPSRYDYTAR